MKNKQKQFLQQLGYTIEDITYIVWHDGGRVSEDWETQHKVILAYKTETDKIIEFKEREYQSSENAPNYYLSDFILEKVYKREFKNVIYGIALEQVKRKNLTENF